VQTGDLSRCSKRHAGAVGTRVASRPPHRPVLAAFPHTVPTSGTDNQALRLDVCSPALALALRQPPVPGPESGSWRAGPHSPRPLSFAPPTPPQIPFPGPLCSPASSKLSAPAISDLSWLNPTPHAIAVYASQPLSPVATQQSLPSGRYSLLGPDLHRLDRTSFAAGALTRSARRRAGEAIRGLSS